MDPEGEETGTGTETPEAGEGETAPETPAGEEESTPRSEADGEEADAEETAAGDETPDEEEPEEGGKKPPKMIPHARAEEMARRRVEKAIQAERTRFRAFLEANREHFDPKIASKRVRDELVDALVKTLRPELKEKPREYYTTDQVDEIVERKLSEISTAHEKEREIAAASNQLDGLKSKYPEVFEAFPSLPRMLAREWGSQQAYEAGLSMQDVGEAYIEELLKGSDIYAKGAATRRQKKIEGAEVLTPPKGGTPPKPQGKPKAKYESIEDVEAAVDRLLG